MLLVVDARSPLAVKGNQIAGGKGTETLEHYEGVRISVRMRLEFMGIANIHAVRAAHDGLVDAVCGRGDFAAACASSSGWFALLQRLLAAVVHVVDAVARHGVPVLVHCSDGWDRTPQLTAGSMLLMDPFYRTIRGFAVLVEKEWCACGHKFAERHGFDDKGHASSDRSPCFLQWIDLVHQVRRQAPDAFEFNVEFLVTVAAAASDGWTGTFLFDCDRLREAHKLKDRAVSLWSHVEARRRDFKNPTYRPDDRVIYPLVGRQHLVLFDAWFQRWHGAVNGVYWDAD
ncbi:phosphatidylinositol-3,5-bisphosphate 3-phosphatase [Aureococcus anophagefferens]|uniref:Phosphatidylinositol-3,5-bisphosphate 3-phosphatase n=1 Tax=Aureococcus anophagefferens TaxID=44056 RepID=A0ABR1FRE4_AURAN